MLAKTTNVSKQFAEKLKWNNINITKMGIVNILFRDALQRKLQP